ncbi:MAG: 16S rRNA (cytidine(1402)-2'-O)-methyltransferase [Bryobacterales bacterium]|nr:16S rRNA (cytidine(1402)-2'-O)-methyltransferase [Bryobacterales bacterium]
MAGVLSIVSTPIGNLEDITLRALRVLREASVIACEDTRHTRKLLEHFGIPVRTVSYHEHNEATRAVELVEAVRRGDRVALVSDAGTPLLSDPGYRVLRAVLEAGLPVEVVPGPAALLVALTGSGLGGGEFFFGGFLPPKRTQRAKVLESLRDLNAALVFYEAPHRVVESLRQIGELLPGRELCAARELTKLHEEWLRGSPADVARQLESRDAVKGEFTLVLGRPQPETGELDAESVASAIAAATASGVGRMEAIKELARARGLSKRDVYRLLEASRDQEVPSASRD